MQKLKVQFEGWGLSKHLGTLASNGSTVLFEYSKEALDDGVEFSSIRMPLDVKTYQNFPREQYQLPGLIADALPDGWGLLLMDRYFRTNTEKAARQISPLDRLAFTGSRAMGALSFYPADAIDLPATDLRLIDLANGIQQVASGQESAEALKQLILVGGVPHGARPKALVQYDEDNGAISTYSDAPGVPWLVKFPRQNEHKEVCAIEHLYCEMARRCGLDLPKTAYFDIDATRAAFGIERFDRCQGMRVPIHTLAGALNINFRVPNASYQTLLRATRGLTLSELEVRKAFERCVFNVVFNNRDDHTKNFSYRMTEQLEWKLSPCYDLTYCTGPGGYHQMDIDGEALHPTVGHLVKLATLDGISEPRAVEIIRRIVDVGLAFKNEAKNYPIRAATRNEIAKAIEGNCDRMRNEST